MKIIVFISLFCLGTIALPAQNRVITDITNFENNKGICRVCLFNSAASFTGKGGTPVQCIEAAVFNKATEVVFTNISPGTYAVFVFHDKNGNGKLDTNFLGIPKEGYGASRNRLPFAAAPAFNDNKFSVTNNIIVRLQIKLRNL